MDEYKDSHLKESSKSILRKFPPGSRTITIVWNEEQTKFAMNFMATNPVDKPVKSRAEAFKELSQVLMDKSFEFLRLSFTEGGSKQ